MTGERIENKEWANGQIRLRSYQLLDALIFRRSRRFAVGMKLNAGPLAYESRQTSQPLSEENEAALAFAA
jgi:hypothetical protein